MTPPQMVVFEAAFVPKPYFPPSLRQPYDMQ
jgi:hypothetical protein